MSTIIIVLLVGMAAVAIYLWRKQNDERRAEGSPALTIQNVQPGAVIKLSRVGTDLDDLDIEIVGRHLYREDGFEWFELEGDTASGKAWVEVEEDDGLEVSISLRKLKLADLGLSREQLEQIERRDEGVIHFEGRDYEYEDCGEAAFLRNGDPSRSERFRYWDFESSDGKWYLSIELWGEREFQAHLSQALSPSQLEIYSLGVKQDAAA